MLKFAHRLLDVRLKDQLFATLLGPSDAGNSKLLQDCQRGGLSAEHRVEIVLGAHHNYSGTLPLLTSACAMFDETCTHTLSFQTLQQSVQILFSS